MLRSDVNQPGSRQTRGTQNILLHKQKADKAATLTRLGAGTGRTLRLTVQIHTLNQQGKDDK